MIYLLIITILVLIAIAAATPYVLKELMKAASYSPIVEDLGQFAFTEEEWKGVFQNEFVEDDRGRSIWDKYSPIINYGETVQENAQRKIFFSSESIYLTDGKRGKSFTVSSLSYFGTGIHFKSIRLLNLSPIKKLQIKVLVDRTDAESITRQEELEFLVPIPESSLGKIDEIMKSYGKTISN